MNFNKYKNISKVLDINFFKFNQKISLKKLILKKQKSLGRSSGRIVCWHRGGGVKNHFRILLNSLNSELSYGILRSIEYDPNRSTYIGIFQLKNGSFYQNIVSSSMKINDVICFNSNNFLNFKIGDLFKLRYAPIGVPLYNLEKYPQSGPVYAKAAGVYAILLSRDVNYAKIRLSSGEERLFNLDCNAVLGMPSNIYNKFHKKYKAGTNRLLNKRPVVRGVAMNPIDHPHGGGAGKTAPGRPSVSPWGKLTKGVPTRKKNILNKLIIKKR